MRAATKFTLLLLFSLVVTFSASAQKIKYGSDGSMKFAKKDGKRAYLLTKNARFQQGSMTIYCDSAYFFKAENSMDAYGNVRIIDSKDKASKITSDRLYYDGNTKKAQLRQNVVYRKESQTLYTDKLDYYTENKSAYFYEKGKVVDSTTVLTSIKGHFQPEQNKVTFTENVVLVTPEERLETNHLVYNTETKVAVTKGYTKIIRKDGTEAESQEGITYNTVEENTTFLSGKIETPNYILSGDQLDFDQVEKIHTVTENVELISKEEDVFVYGDRAKAWKDDGITKIWGNTLMKKPFEEDTLYMVADTLISYDSEDESKKKIVAYGNIRIFKEDLQSIADSLTYSFKDSVLYFHQDPVLWTGHNQLEAEIIEAHIKDSKLDKMFMKTNAFVINEDTLGNFNQVKGRDMTIHVRDEVLDKVDVNGNSESIYFTVDQMNQFMGMNKILCSDITFRFKNRKIDNISFYEKPEGDFIPPHEIEEPQRRLKDFNWRIEERPELEELLMVRGWKLPAAQLEDEQIELEKPQLKKAK